MSAISDKAALQVGVEAATAESGGLMELAVIRPSDMPALRGDYPAGSTDAALLLRLVLDTTIKIDRARPGSRLLCVACPRELQRGYAVCAAIPAKDNPTRPLPWPYALGAGRTGQPSKPRLWRASPAYGPAHVRST